VAGHARLTGKFLHPLFHPFSSKKVRYIEPHGHMVSRTTDDYEAMILAGCSAVCEPAFWAGYDRSGPQGFYDYFCQLTDYEPKRAAKFGLPHFTWLCINPKESEDTKLAAEVLSIIPEFLNRPNVLGIGEIGLNKNTRNELQVLEEHIQLAALHDPPPEMRSRRGGEVAYKGPAGMKDVIVDRHFRVMRDGAVVCNTGHYDCEINLGELGALTKRVREVRANNKEYTLADGRHIFVLADGRLVNLAAAEGHPSEVMDMSFANQFMSMVRLAREGKTLAKTVHDIPPAQDQEIALLKLQTMGLGLDVLTPEQKAYATDYSAGT